MKINVEIEFKSRIVTSIGGPIEIDDNLIDLAPNKLDFVAQEIKPWIEAILRVHGVIES